MISLLKWLGIAICIATIYVGYLIKSINIDPLNSFPAYSRLFESWNKSIISSIKLTDYDNCFADKKTNLLSYEWPGTIKGCDCNHIRYSWVRQEYYREYRRKVLPKSCDEMQVRLECINIVETQPKIIRKWRNNHLCGQILDTTFNYYDLLNDKKICSYSNKDKEDSKDDCFNNNSFKSCGLIDTLGQELFFPKDTKCPYSGYSLKTKGNDLTEFNKKHREIYTKYIHEYKNDHEKHTYELADYNFLKIESKYKSDGIGKFDCDQSNDKDCSKPRIPIGFFIAENGNICLDTKNDYSFQEGEFPLINKRKSTKNNFCIAKLNAEYLINKLDDINEEHGKIIDLIIDSHEDKLKRFRALDEYNKHIFYDQAEVAQNFMHSKRFPTFLETNISLFEEVFIGWKKTCMPEKEIFELLKSRATIFELDFIGFFDHLKLHQKIFVIIFAFQILAVLFGIMSFKNNTTKYGRLSRPQRYTVIICLFVIIFGSSFYVLQLSNSNLKIYKKYEIEGQFIQNSISCSDEYTNLLFDIFREDYFHNLFIFQMINFTAIFIMLLSMFSLVIDIVCIDTFGVSRNIIHSVTSEINSKSESSQNHSISPEVSPIAKLDKKDISSISKFSIEETEKHNEDDEEETIFKKNS